METWSRDLDLTTLAEQFGTPLYIHHQPSLIERFRRWAELVGDPGNVRYPVKANPSPTVLRSLAGLGAGADCASGIEVRLALEAGVPIGRVSYNSPAPEPGLMRWLLRAGATVVADSAEALDALREEPAPEEVNGELFVRVNPGGLPGYKVPSEVQKYTAHGAATSQFGVPSEEVPGRIADHPLPVTGLHVHVGTQMDNLDTFVQGVRFLHHLKELLERETRHRIATLNLGGGLGIPFADDQIFPTVGELAAALRPELRSDLRYEVEPGNALVGDTFALLTRVVATKRARGKRWAIADVGTDQLVKHTVARWEHQILGPDLRPLPTEGPDGLAGPLCFAGDVLLPETELGEIATGDLLLVQHAGAYCEAVSSRFNGRRAPAHAVIGADGEARPGRRREDTFYDPTHQTWLPWLPESRPVLPVEGHGNGHGRENGALPAERVAALQSAYMAEGAAHDGYELLSMRRTGPGSYAVSFAVRGAVDFVAMPLALRLVGDATIVAAGLEMGWETKRAPVWATRLSMRCAGVLPMEGGVECQVALTALAPSPKPGVRYTATAYYRLGSGEVTGTAAVVIPEEAGE